MGHRLKVYTHIEEMGGLHCGHRAARGAAGIDNQLRGRAGRQGDRGSSRFFSTSKTTDEMFAGPKTLACSPSLA